eukprot:3491139-Prymnesium_polylepis.2
MEARRRLEPRQVCKLFCSHGRQLHKAPLTVTEPAQLVLRARVVGDVQAFEDQLAGEHAQRREDEE